jgi:hypothetical protein
MTHLLVAVRGQRDRINNWENDLLARYNDYEFKKGEKGALQLGVRPVRLYEIVFPENKLQETLSLVNPGASWNEKYNKYFNWIRKLLGLKKIPEYQRVNYPHNIFVEVVGIGIKDDRKDADGIELL